MCYPRRAGLLLDGEIYFQKKTKKYFHILGKSGTESKARLAHPYAKVILVVLLLLLLVLFWKRNNTNSSQFLLLLV